MKWLSAFAIERLGFASGAFLDTVIRAQRCSNANPNLGMFNYFRKKKAFFQFLCKSRHKPAIAGVDIDRQSHIDKVKNKLAPEIIAKAQELTNRERKQEIDRDVYLGQQIAKLPARSIYIGYHAPRNDDTLFIGMAALNIYSTQLYLIPEEEPPKEDNEANFKIFETYVANKKGCSGNVSNYDPPSLTELAMFQLGPNRLNRVDQLPEPKDSIRNYGASVPVYLKNPKPSGWYQPLQQFDFVVFVKDVYDTAYKKHGKRKRCDTKTRSSKRKRV